ncbi:MAG: glycosyltransferase [Bacteroidetes bacterium]|nr:glycosyltransferase [Bacteroidota bacterium]
MKKPVILIFTRYYLPGFKAGGPIRSVANLVEWLGEEFRFKVVTSDRDLDSDSPYPGISLNTWTKRGKADVFYTKKGDEFRQFKKILRSAKGSAVLLNSFFDSHYSVLPLILNRYLSRLPVLLSPRGEFSEGAMQIKKLKKKLFVSFSSITGLHRGVGWALSNKHEKNDLQRVFSVSEEQIYFTPNLPSGEPGSSIRDVDKENESIRMIFLSRISSKKNVHYIMDLLSGITDCRVTLDLYGTLEDSGYWQDIQKKIASLPQNITVRYKGAIPHHAVLGKLQEYHLFLLPTKGENFGHAIYESMIAGTPVLISRQTPWRQLQKKGLGWDIPLDQPEKFREIIRQVASMSKEEINNLKRNVFNSIRKVSVSDDVVQNSRALHKFMGGKP